MCEAASSVRHEPRHLGNPPKNSAGLESSPEDELTTTSSIFEFLQQERRCDGGGAIDEDDSELDIDSIFEEINRLSGDTRGRCVEDILREAEELISKQELGQLEVPLLAVRKTMSGVVQPSRLPMRKKTTEVPSVLQVHTSDNKSKAHRPIGNVYDGYTCELIADTEHSSDDEGFIAHYELNTVSEI